MKRSDRYRLRVDVFIKCPLWAWHAEQRARPWQLLSSTMQQQRGYSSAVSRNEKLHLLAKQKRSTTPTSASDHALDKQSSAGPNTSKTGRSTRTKVVRLSTVLQQAPQHFDRVKVRSQCTSTLLHAAVINTAHAHVCAFCAHPASLLCTSG